MTIISRPGHGWCDSYHTFKLLLSLKFETCKGFDWQDLSSPESVVASFGNLSSSHSFLSSTDGQKGINLWKLKLAGHIAFAA